MGGVGTHCIRRSQEQGEYKAVERWAQGLSSSAGRLAYPRWINSRWLRDSSFRRCGAGVSSCRVYEEVAEKGRSRLEAFSLSSTHVVIDMEEASSWGRVGRGGVAPVRS